MEAEINALLQNATGSFALCEISEIDMTITVSVNVVGMDEQTLNVTETTVEDALDNIGYSANVTIITADCNFHTFQTFCY